MNTAPNSLRLCENLKPWLQPHVLWYRHNEKDLTFVVNQYLDHPQIIRLVTDFEVALFEKCNGLLTTGAIARSLSVPVDRVVQSLETWERLAPGMFRWITSFEDEHKRARYRAVATKMRDQWKAAHEAAPDNVFYHSHDIADAMKQFDDIETTLSHVFRKPHRALGNRAYGEAFADKLVEMDLLPPGARILEIGCGTGFFANSLLGRLAQNHPALYRQIHYTLFDLSSTLQSSQRERCRAHEALTSFETGNIEDHDFNGRRFDLILANEVIADLRVGVAQLAHLKEHTPESEAEQQALKYTLAYESTDVQPKQAIAINLGAIRLLERLPHLLSPGGAAVITEYGDVDSFPQVVEMSGHREYSIHFGHLLQVAEDLSTQPQLNNLGSFLAADAEAETIETTSLHLLSRYLLPFLGRDGLERLAYDTSMLREVIGEDIDLIGNLRFQPLKTVTGVTPSNFLTPFRFQILLCRSAASR